LSAVLRILHVLLPRIEFNTKAAWGQITASRFRCCKNPARLAATARDC
jgi:hypothetical protein